MHDKRVIPAREFCEQHDIEVAFIHSLAEFGLLQVTNMEEESYIEEDDLESLEKMKRLHYELQINLEGIDAIRHLLSQIDAMQRELILLKNRLRFYETPE